MCVYLCVYTEGGGSAVLKKTRVWCVHDEDAVRSVGHKEFADLALRHSKLCFWQENSLVCAQILVHYGFFHKGHRLPFCISVIEVQIVTGLVALARTLNCRSPMNVTSRKWLGMEVWMWFPVISPEPLNPIPNNPTVFRSP